jgi:phosphoribosyl 1,2-cyclic phosphate phosphodiesterase
MKVTMLGTGTSSGVPLIGCDCAVCHSSDPRNRRRRCSILIETGSETIIVDTGPDFREQSLDVGLKSLDAVIFTHAHADHVHGIDDVRALNNLLKKPIPAYGTRHTFERIMSRFDYAFAGGFDGYGFWRPELVRHDIDGPFRIRETTVIPFRQGHGRGESTGIRIGNFAYSPDVDVMPEEGFEVLDGVEIWIVDALRDRPHPSHAHLERTLGWIERVKPKRAYLTHMNHEVDHEVWSAKLPDGVEVGHDGLVIDCG